MRTGLERNKTLRLPQTSLEGIGEERLALDACEGLEVNRTAHPAAITNGMAGAQEVVLKELAHGEGGGGWGAGHAGTGRVWSHAGMSGDLKQESGPLGLVILQRSLALLLETHTGVRS